MDFKTTLSFGELEFTVNAVYFTDLTCIKDDQGNFIGGPLHDDTDLYDITFAGESLSRKQERRLIHIYGWDKFNTWLTMEGRKAYKKEQSNKECLKCWRNSKAKTETEGCQYLRLQKRYNDNGNPCPFFTDSI